MAAVNLISSIQARSCQGTFVDPSGLQPAMGVVSQPGYPDAPLPYEEIKAGAGSQVARYLNHEGPPPRGEPPPKEKEDARQAGEVGAAAPPTDVDTTGSSLEIDAQAATTAPEDWTQNPYVQIEGGFLAGVSLGLVPMGGVGQQLADAGELLPHGTPEARLGLSVGMIVGGIATTAGGVAGGLLGGATTATGAGAPVGVPAMVVSTTLVVGGAANVAVGIRALTQALSTGGGSPRTVPTLKIDDAQFGKKVGKHAGDFGRDPASPAHRQWVRKRIESVVRDYDEIRRGSWNPRGGGGNDYLFFRQGADVVVTKSNGEFVTILAGGQSNGWFNAASPL